MFLYGELLSEARTPQADFFSILLGACSILTILLRRTMAKYLLCSRPQKNLPVFQRIRIRFFVVCGRATACQSFAV